MDEKKESFKHVSVDYPTDYSTHAKVVLFDYDKFNKWLGRLEDAHEREVREHTLEYDIDGLSDRELAEHGLVRLPVDADGVRWTGEEHFFRDAQVGGARFLFGLSYFGDGKWEIIDHYQNEVGAAPAMCRHVPEKPAGPHAALAAELRSAVRKGYEHGYGSAGDYRAALYNIAERLAQMDGDDGKEQ